MEDWSLKQRKYYAMIVEKTKEFYKETHHFLVLNNREKSGMKKRKLFIVINFRLLFYLDNLPLRDSHITLRNAEWKTE